MPGRRTSNSKHHHHHHHSSSLLNTKATRKSIIIPSHIIFIVWVVVSHCVVGAVRSFSAVGGSAHRRLGRRSLGAANQIWGLSAKDGGSTRRDGANFRSSPVIPGDAAAAASTSSTTTTTTSTAQSSAASSSSSTTQILTDSPEFLRPDRDLREYRTIRLSNGLEVLLVSNPTLAVGAVGVEAASVHVQAGHFDDRIPGLAHFHEHMLFLGTEKFPAEDDYETFLSQFGGHSNAYTDMEDTNYYFSITTEQEDPNQTSVGLRGALDRLAQFFVAPTFNPDAVERETRAIDSEYRNGKASDNWRTFQIVKSTCTPEHPFSNFGCGNYETLRGQGLEKLLEKLRNFWESYYKTYNMRLAVVGHANLDALQAAVEESFGQLEASQGEPRRYKNRADQTFVRENAVYGKVAYGPEQLGKIRRIIPYVETRSVKILFGTPPLDDPLLRRTKPYRVLSHILGHEGPGSLHALLNSLGYLNSLSSGVGIDTSDFSLFSLTLSLTPKGMEEYEQVLQLVFHWMALLRENKDRLEPYHDELRQISDINFRFRENGDPTEFCSIASELLFDEDLEHPRFLRGGSDTKEFDPNALDAFLERLRPENCMVHITSSDFDVGDGNVWEAEKWYGGQYRVEDIDEELMESWGNPSTIDERLQWPGLNEYIPTDFSLRAEDNGDETLVEKSDTRIPPKILMEEPKLRLWHKMDRFWKIPKAYIRVGVLSPHVYSTPRSMTYNRIFQKVLNDDLNSFVYDASLAGCNYRISCLPTGYRLSVTGYSEKLPFLFDVLTSRVLSLIQEMKDGDSILQARFDKAKQELLRSTKNYRLDSPYEVANYNARLMIEKQVWYIDSYINEMEGTEAEANPLSMEECAQVAEIALMGRVRAEVLCMGNINVEAANDVAEVLKEKFLDKARSVSDEEIPRYRSLKLPTREEAGAIFGPEAAERTVPIIYAELARSPDEENNAVELIIQATSELELGYDGLATLDLITHMAYNSAFNQLRTKEQLGYTVSAFARKTTGSAWGMSVVAMGSEFEPGHMEERIEAWLLQFRKELGDMEPEAMATEGQAIVAQLLEEETKLSQEIGRVWTEILNTETSTPGLRKPNFSRLELVANGLKTGDGTNLTAEQLKARVLAFFDSYIALSPERRSMSSRVYSQNEKESYDAIAEMPGVLTSHQEIRETKEFLASWPTVPYWRIPHSDKT